MDVGFLTASVSREAGGILASLQGLSRALDAYPRVSARVFGVADAYSALDAAGWCGVDLSVSRRVGPARFGFAPGLVSQLVGADLDLLDVHGIWMYQSVASLQWHRRTRRPYVVSPNGMLDEWALRNAAWKKRLASLGYESTHLRGAACIRAVTATEAQAIRRFGLRNPIAVVPYGVELPDLARLHLERAAHRRRAAGARTVLYIGRLHKKKGLVPLLRGWKAAAGTRGAQSGPWRLVIAGDARHRYGRSVRRLAEELGIARDVHFVGAAYGEAKRAAFVEADAFILPSLSEGLPVAMLEAWAFALPALVTRACNVPEGFDAGAALELRPTAGSVAETLGTLFSMSDDERVRMGARGRALVEEQFTWHRVAADLHATYTWLLGGGPAPALVEPRV